MDPEQTLDMSRVCIILMKDIFAETSLECKRSLFIALVKVYPMVRREISRDRVALRWPQLDQLQNQLDELFIHAKQICK
jgi:hypothetical protein